MTDADTFLPFPPSFAFGSSIAAYQVEGNTSNQRQTDWDTFFDNNPSQIIRPGEIGPNWFGEKENIEKDLKAISTLGLTMQRLSIEWARIQPEEGTIDRHAIEYYRYLIDICKKYHLEPIVTINHFALPDWIAKKGGWENPSIVKNFINYVSILLEYFGDINIWIIINEPSNVTYVGHLLGIWPPNKHSLISTLRARKNIIFAQQKAYEVIKKNQQSSEVGNAFSFLWLRSQDPNSYPEKMVTKFLNYLVNTNFVSATKDYMDFLGINYYTGYYIDLNLRFFSPTMRNEATYIPHHLPFAKTVRPKTYKTDMGWPIVPEFFTDLLKHMYHAYKKPIMITENGIADRDDIYRPYYILSHLTAVWKAIDLGIPIKAYIHWATIDNLEWVEGFEKRFGLIEVDPVSGKRQLRNGSRIYKKIVNERGIYIKKYIEDFIPHEQKVYAQNVINQLLTFSQDSCVRIAK